MKGIKHFKRSLIDVFYTWMEEFRMIFKDPGVMVLFLLAPIAYPILYATIYKNETLREVPVAVVDLSASQTSRQYIRSLDATPDIKIAYRCSSLEEAKRLYQQRKAHGIVVIPAGFQDQIMGNLQANVSAYSDMSSFMYYKALMSAISYVSNQMGVEIQVARLMAGGADYQQAVVTAAPYTYSYNPMYNPQSGYASFLLPAVLILILHQTLLLGIGMRAGTEYERNPQIYQNQISKHRQSVFGMLAGKSLCYLSMYAIIAFYAIEIIPHWFQIPHIGSMGDKLLFMLPFLLATIFFSLTIASFLRSRENSMLLFLITTIPLLFLSGVPWPSASIPAFWRGVAWLLPSTSGVQGYIKINTMGASLHSVWHEYLHLWILTGLYFIAAYLIRLHLLKRTQKQ